MHRAAVLVLLLLPGCASIRGALAPVAYEPWHGPVADKPTYDHSLIDCQQSAVDYTTRREFSPKRIAIQSGKGVVATGPAAAAAGAAGLLVAGVGGISTGTTETLDELLGSQDDVDRVTAQCMRDKGQDSKAWEIWDPWLSK